MQDVPWDIENDIDQMQTDLDKLFEPQMSQFGNVKGQQKANQADVMSTKDLSLIQSNLMSINDYRKGKTSQLAISNEFTFKVKPNRNIRTAFQKQVTSKDQKIVTKIFHPQQINRKLVFYDVRNNIEKTRVPLPPIIIQQNGVTMKFPEKVSKINVEDTYQLVEEPSPARDNSYFFLTQQK
ncbi:Hypothetical_protein [Hexamita inflata]|uniref:Hypothetical_protein n=1 Tax=Hexamita inflata TaxID=28002 RepID=A0AA86TC49_9EUKA|nr:Hypothetical protein HINF_LOCUS32 [Hexamita inflata]CAI9955474.1 Hypothetical protein HINF_LOCUS43119 [Hexamita inflata]